MRDSRLVVYAKNDRTDSDLDPTGAIYLHVIVLSIIYPIRLWKVYVFKYLLCIINYIGWFS